jgi:hypothetical protein
LRGMMSILGHSTVISRSKMDVLPLDQTGVPIA